MTKKDFVAIAAIIRTRAESARGLITAPDVQEHARVAARTQCELFAQDMADYFAQRNPRFDRERFLKACGVAS